MAPSFERIRSLAVRIEVPRRVEDSRSTAKITRIHQVDELLTLETSFDQVQRMCHKSRGNTSYKPGNRFYERIRQNIVIRHIACSHNPSFFPPEIPSS